MIALTLKLAQIQICEPPPEVTTKAKAKRKTSKYRKQFRDENLPSRHLEPHELNFLLNAPEGRYLTKNNGREI